MKKNSEIDCLIILYEYIFYFLALLSQEIIINKKIAKLRKNSLTEIILISSIHINII